MPEINFTIPCPATLMPTKADLAKIFMQIAELPSQLQVIAERILREAEEEAYEAALAKIRPILEAAEKVRQILKQIDTILGNFPISVSKPYYASLVFLVDEWERKIDAMIQEFKTFVHAKIMELIGAIVPINLEIPIPLLGIAVNIVKLFSDPEYRAALKRQIAAQISHFMSLLPDAFKIFLGDFGLYSIQMQIQAVWNYMMAMVKKIATQLVNEAIGKLISMFKPIWDLLSLPPLPSLDSLRIIIAVVTNPNKVFVSNDMQDIIDQIIGDWKSNLASLKQKSEQVKATIGNIDLRNTRLAELTEQKIEIYNQIVHGLRGVVITVFDHLGAPHVFTMLQIIGGDLEDFVKSPEKIINRIVEAARDFAIDWVDYCMKQFMLIIMSFLEKIGLSALLEWLNFTFCDFLKLIGMPTSISVSIPDVQLHRTA